MNLTQVPTEYFQNFAYKLDCSVESIPHKWPPFYKMSTRRFSYKMYSLDTFLACLHEQKDTLVQTSTFFAGVMPIAEESNWKLMLDEKIKATMGRNAYKLCNEGQPQKATLHASVEVGKARVGQPGKSNVYDSSVHRQLTIRFFVQKIPSVLFLVIVENINYCSSDILLPLYLLYYEK